MSERERERVPGLQDELEPVKQSLQERNAMVADLENALLKEGLRFSKAEVCRRLRMAPQQRTRDDVLRCVG